jgi:hypothetical protein
MIISMRKLFGNDCQHELCHASMERPVGKSLERSSARFGFNVVWPSICFITVSDSWNGICSCVDPKIILSNYISRTILMSSDIPVLCLQRVWVWRWIIRDSADGPSFFHLQSFWSRCDQTMNWLLIYAVPFFGHRATTPWFMMPEMFPMMDRSGLLGCRSSINLKRSCF